MTGHILKRNRDILHLMTSTSVDRLHLKLNLATLEAFTTVTVKIAEDATTRVPNIKRTSTLTTRSRGLEDLTVEK